MKFCPKCKKEATYIRTKDTCQHVKVYRCEHCKICFVILPDNFIKTLIELGSIDWVSERFAEAAGVEIGSS